MISKPALSFSLKGFQKWLYSGFVPMLIHRWEWILMRVFLAALVVYSMQSTRPFLLEDQPDPVGIARIIDLTFLSQPGPVCLDFFSELKLPLGGRLKLHGPGHYDTVMLLAIVLGIVYTLGRGLWFVLPMFTLVYTLPWTLSNSQGFDHHGYQLTAMVLVFQTGVAWWWKWKKWRGKSLPKHSIGSWMVYYSTGMIAMSYTVSAITKLINSKGLWLLQSHYFCANIIKGHRNAQYDNPTYQPIEDPEMAVWLMQHPWLTRVFFGGGFFLEFVAILALHSRPWSLIIGLAIITFHRSVWWLMRLEFEMHECLIWVFLVNVPFWLWWISSARRGSSLAR